MARIFDIQNLDIAVIGQILGIALSCFNFFVYRARTREGILLSKLILDIGYSIQQCMIGAFTGALVNGIGIFRDVVFFNRQRRPWASHRFWLYLFVVLMGLSPVFTWIGPASLLPAFGSAFAVVGFYCEKPQHTRLFILLATIPWLIYAMIITNYGMILNNVIQFVSVTLGLIRDHRESCTAKRETT